MCERLLLNIGASHYMDLKDFAVYTMLLEITGDDGLFALNAKQVASEFLEMSPSSAYRALKKLEDRGWIERVRPFKRTVDGDVPVLRRVVSLAEWGQKNKTRAVQKIVSEDGYTTGHGIESVSSMQGSSLPITGAPNI